MSKNITHKWHPCLNSGESFIRSSNYCLLSALKRLIGLRSEEHSFSNYRYLFKGGCHPINIASFILRHHKVLLRCKAVNTNSSCQVEKARRERLRYSRWTVYFDPWGSVADSRQQLWRPGTICVCSWKCRYFSNL